MTKIFSRSTSSNHFSPLASLPPQNRGRWRLHTVAALATSSHDCHSASRTQGFFLSSSVHHFVISSVHHWDPKTEQTSSLLAHLDSGFLFPSLQHWNKIGRLVQINEIHLGFFWKSMNLHLHCVDIQMKVMLTV